jgi:hypothetical protein
LSACFNAAPSRSLMTRTYYKFHASGKEKMRPRRESNPRHSLSSQLFGP